MTAAKCTLLLAFALTACAPPYDPTASSGMAAIQQPPLNQQTYTAVDSMLDRAPELLGNKGPLVVGSVEDIRDVNSSTPFGNIISEMVRTRLVQHGLRVTEMRVRSSVLLERASGELLLSRDKRALLPAPAAAEIVTGTYAVGSGKVYVSLKIINPSDGHIRAAADFVTDRTLDVDQLLTSARG
ncbi:MAG TPA: FlgO family outer membrane protein [Rhodopila sp.]|nr:FlgO family outer membrane protein [Rhodopila sp.]